MNELSNSGENSGVIAGAIFGDVTLNSMQKKRLPSILPFVIEKISDLCTDDSLISTYEIPIAFRYEDKIRYNDIKSYKEILKEYGIYYGICNSVLNLLDDMQPNRKNKLLRSVHHDYLQIKSQLLMGDSSNINSIRKQSDNIIFAMVQILKNKIEKSYSNENIFSEDLESAITIFLCYCFGECKILEKPE